ncbi:MAG: glycoside hydrolase domain-containing protein, partial [Omnitrophica WOR_2 bacterium]
FYPVNPANGTYCFGSPQIPSATINLENGNKFSIVAYNAGGENIYIQEIALNGKPYTKLFIKHEDIVKGGKLEFFMGKKPNKKLSRYERPT